MPSELHFTSKHLFEQGLQCTCPGVGEGPVLTQTLAAHLLRFSSETEGALNLLIPSVIRVGKHDNAAPNAPYANIILQ